MNVQKGYVDEPIEEGIDLKKEILRLKKERNAVIMAHYYQREEIQQLADHIGDSLALAQLAAKTDAPVIILCGVHFMGETAKILCPDKTVIVPDLSAGCSLADSCPADEFEKFVKAHPDHTVISYVNTSAAVKAVTDVVVTSSNAKEIVGSLPEDEKIIADAATSEEIMHIPLVSIPTNNGIQFEKIIIHPKLKILFEAEREKKRYQIDYNTIVNYKTWYLGNSTKAVEDAIKKMNTIIEGGTQ